MNSKQLQKFITNCTLTFKAFDYSVELSRNKANLWHFTSLNPSADRKYMVYCTPDLEKVRSLIKIALKKVPKECRLVVVTYDLSDEHKTLAEEAGYTLVGHDELKAYGAQMLEARAREAA